MFEFCASNRSPSLPTRDPHQPIYRLSFDQLAAQFKTLSAPGHSVCRVLAVDGLSGSGKSTFAASAARALAAPVFQIDDIIPGWDAVAESLGLVRDLVLTPLCTGLPARWRRFDWDRLIYMEEHQLDPCPTLVLDGCGAGARLLAPLLTAIVWLDADPAVCERRVRAREGWEQYEPFREGWIRQETALQAAERTHDRAWLRVDSERSELENPGQHHFITRISPPTWSRAVQDGAKKFSSPAEDTDY